MANEKRLTFRDKYGDPRLKVGILFWKVRLLSWIRNVSARRIFTTKLKHFCVPTEREISAMANNQETKRERFVRVAEKRTQKVLDDLRELSKCYHPDVYEYTQDDLQKIFTAIEEELQRTKDHLAGLHRFTLSEKEDGA